MKNMSQEELDRLSRAAGHGQGLKLTPEIMQKAADSISRMDADQLKNLPKMARQTQERYRLCQREAGGGLIGHVFPGCLLFRPIPDPAHHLLRLRSQKLPTYGVLLKDTSEMWSSVVSLLFRLI